MYKYVQDNISTAVITTCMLWIYIECVHLYHLSYSYCENSVIKFTCKIMKLCCTPFQAVTLLWVIVNQTHHIRIQHY